MRHVGLNLLYLVPGEVGGSEIYARRLIAALAAERPDVRFTAFAGREAAPSLRDEGWPPNAVVHELPVNAAVKPVRAAAELTLLPAAAARAGVDLLHSLGTTSPPLTRGASVVTVLDLIYEHYPDTFPTAARLGLKALVGPGARAATRVIAISKAVKADVVERLRVPAGHVDVVYLGFGMRREARPTAEAALRARLGLGGGRVVLCVSAALVHKNLDRLIDAFSQLGSGFEDCRLVLAGHAGREQARLAELAASRGVGERVVLTGWIDAADLEGLYALAACCAYPSLHEGFGLPVLEAMVRGVPLACSDATALPEVAGDAAELFDPLDTSAIAGALQRLLVDADHAARLSERGRQRAATFTWERCARDTLATYQRALSTGSRGSVG
ncbi:MAG: glycosyltransferase family 1 protein [Solirubrobacterales bacterium]|jgi:glycosyltransferase involved in cell wall biosynthesis|nr:glycosyltransferase family 1 protein [Solirubrobacterales bacterium]